MGPYEYFDKFVLPLHQQLKHLVDNHVTQLPEDVHPHAHAGAVVRVLLTLAADLTHHCGRPESLFLEGAQHAFQTVAARRACNTTTRGADTE